MVLHSLITFTDIAALCALCGLSFCILWTANSADNDSGGRLFAVSVRRMLMIIMAALVLSSISNLVQRTMEMSGLGITAIIPVLPDVLFRTHFGRIGLVRAGGLGLALVVLFVGRKRMLSRPVGFLLLCASAIIAFSRSATSHAADFGDLSVKELSDWIHLLSSASWAGTLIAIAGVFRLSHVLDDSRKQFLVFRIADRFYLLFGPALSLLVLTGAYNAWVEVGSFHALVSSPYGRLLSVKLILFILLTLRYIAPPQHGQDDSAFAAKFLRRVRVETGMVLGIILCVAMLTHEVPAKHFEHMISHQQGSMESGRTVERADQNPF